MDTATPEMRSRISAAKLVDRNISFVDRSTAIFHFNRCRWDLRRIFPDLAPEEIWQLANSRQANEVADTVRVILNMMDEELKPTPLAGSPAFWESETVDATSLEILDLLDAARLQVESMQELYRHDQLKLARAECQGLIEVARRIHRTLKARPNRIEGRQLVELWIANRPTVPSTAGRPARILQPPNLDILDGLTDAYDDYVRDHGKRPSCADMAAALAMAKNSLLNELKRHGFTTWTAWERTRLN